MVVVSVCCVEAVLVMVAGVGREAGRGEGLTVGCILGRQQQVGAASGLLAATWKYYIWMNVRGC